MMGGDACVALGGVLPRRGGGCGDDGWGRLRRPLIPGRVGAGVVEMLGGDACVALGGGATQPPVVLESSHPKKVDSPTLIWHNTFATIRRGRIVA